MARILVVDDDPDILKMTETVLSSAGHTVFTAEDAIRGMEWLNHIEFDLLLSDANMPLYSGFELISTIRNNDKFRNLTIAMLTGLKERKDVERAIDIGVDDYIVKPLDPLILIQKVAVLLQKRPVIEGPEIYLGGTTLSHASLKHSVTMETVSELGAALICDIPLRVGQVLDLNAEFFKELDAPAPAMKVMTCEPVIGGHQFRAQVIFLGANEVLLQKIRRWLYSHGASSQKGA